MVENYYRILGVDPDATPDEIRSAYRRAVKRLHPDRSKGASGPFRAVQEAYESLRDPVRRKQYDDELSRAKRAQRAAPTTRAQPPRRRHPAAEPLIPTRHATSPRDALFGGPFPFALEELLEHLLGAPTWPTREWADEMHVEVSLSREAAQRGGYVRLLLPTEVTCPTCGGWGGDVFFECRRCSGRGLVAGDVPVEVAFPPRVPDGATRTVSVRRPGIRDALLTLHFRIDRW